MARPRKSKVDKQSVVVVLNLTLADKKRLDAAAARIGLPVATAARLYALRGADEAAAPHAVVQPVAPAPRSRSRSQHGAPGRRRGHARSS